MKNKKLIALLVSFGIALSANAQTIGRNETVYVNLDAKGQPSGIEVVTWLRNDGSGPAEDRATLANIQNIKGLTQPVEQDGRITFDTADRNIFYKGTTDKALPVSIGIEYFLDGRSLPFDALEGKSGKLKIVIHIRNQTQAMRNINYTEVGGGKKTTRDKVYTPFVVQVSTSMDIDMFSNVEPGDGVFAVVGNTYRLSWITLPLPEATIELKADARDIVMPSIMLTAVPKMVPLPEELNGMEAKLNQIYDGVDQVGGYLEKLHDGANQIADGNATVYDNIVAATDKSALMIEALDAQAKLAEASIKINREIRTKIIGLQWLGSFRKMDNALDVENQLLGLLLEGGRFSDEVLDFIVDNGGDKPEMDEFPASIATIGENVEKSVIETREEKLPDLARLKDGSRDLADSILMVKNEGTDEIKSRMRSESADAVRMFAKIRLAEKMANEYDRFAGKKSGVKSSVQFIMKTPGKYSN